MKKWKSEQRAIKDRIGNDITTAEALEEKIAATFNELDTSGDGFIDHSELKVGMEAMGVKITDDTAQRMIAEVDDNADQQIDMGESSSLLCFERATSRSYSCANLLCLVEWTALVKNTLASFKVIELPPSASAANEKITFEPRELTVSSSPRVQARKDFSLSESRHLKSGSPTLTKRSIARRRQRRASAPAMMELTLMEAGAPGSERKGSFRFPAFRSPGGSTWRRMSTVPKAPEFSPENSPRKLSREKTASIHCDLAGIEESPEVKDEEVKLPMLPSSGSGSNLMSSVPPQ
jgi:hypothetical protein